MVGLRGIGSAALLAAVAVGAGCGGGEGEGGGDGDVEGKVTLLAFGDPEEVQGYRDVIRAYGERRPDVDVQLVEASDREDLLARLGTAFSGGSPPDLFLINYRYFGQFAVKDVLDPLGPRLAESDVFDEDDFYEPAMEAFRHDGELVCMPQNISSLVVYWNKNLFRKHRVPAPEAGWTWSDMVRAATRMTRDNDRDGTVDYHGIGAEPEMIRLAPFVWSNGGEIVDDEQRPTRFTLDSKAALDAIEDYFLLGSLELTPDDQEVEAEDLESRFMNGRLAMILSSRRSTPAFRTIEGFDWDIAPLPVHEQPAGILHSDAYCLTEASGNKEAAWDFVQFALGPDGAPYTAASGRTVPSLKSVAESEAFLDPTKKPESSRIFLDTIPQIRRVPNISTWPEIEDVSAGLLEAGMFQGKRARVVVEELQRATEPIFARAE